MQKNDNSQMLAVKGASPDSKLVITNPPYNNSIRSTEKELLFLTNIRTIQQDRRGARFREDMYQQIQETRKNLQGKKFQIRKEPPKFCKKHKIALLSCKDGKIDEAKFSRIGCKSWTCPACCVHKALKVKYLLREVIKINNLGYFLTLTLDPIKIPFDFRNDTHRYITKIFNHFMTILKRHKANSIDEKLKYVWVIEFQKNGNAHLHILLNKFLPIKVIRKLWVHVGGGVMMKVVEVKTIEGISNYIGDYIVKGVKGDLERESGFKYFQRRYSISKTCIRPSAKKKAIYPFLSFKEQYYTLSGQGLGWVYNTLYDLDEKDIVIQFTKENSKL